MPVRHRILIWSCVLVAIALAAVFDPTYVSRGLLLREAFFRYRPTSYWRQVFTEAGAQEKVPLENFEDFSYRSDSRRVLLALLSDRDANVSRTALTVVNGNNYSYEIEMAVRNRLKDSDRVLRLLAACRLGQMGRNARGSVSKLAEAIENQQADKEEVAEINYALCRIDAFTGIRHRPWKRFESQNWKFSAVGPGDLEENTSSMDTNFGPIPVTTFQSTFCAVSINFAVSDHPQEITQTQSKDEWYDLLVDALPAGLGGDLLSSERIVRSGKEGRDSRVEVAEKAIMRCCVFIVGRRLYQLVIAKPPKSSLGEDFDQAIINSLEIQYAGDEVIQDENGVF
jgi:hypothetical protein